jgi:hypothetical protein
MSHLGLITALPAAATEAVVEPQHSMLCSMNGEPSAMVNLYPAS